jgi:hypothetical protein
MHLSGTFLAAIALAAGCAVAISEEGEVGPDAGGGAADDPGPGPDQAPPGQCEPTTVQLLGNAAFDDEPLVWQGDVAVIKTYDPQIIRAHSGERAAWLAGFNNADQLLTQQVTVPVSATTLALTGFRCFVSDDPAGTGDSLEIELRTTTGVLLESLGAFGNQDAEAVCDWEEFSLAAGAAHAGEPLLLALRARNDAAGPTAFHLDTLRLDALACP